MTSPFTMENVLLPLTETFFTVPWPPVNTSPFTLPPLIATSELPTVIPYAHPP